MRESGRRVARCSRVLALCALAAVTGCSTVQLDDPERDALNDARRLWLAADVGHYRITVQRLCFCAFDVTRERIVEVEEGEVVSVRYADTGELEHPDLVDLFPGVDGLFDIVAEALDQDAHSIVVEYDEQLGYPVEIVIDYLQFAIDEELTMRAKDLVPLS